MKCPKCKAEMLKTEFEQLVGDEIFESWQCSVCGYRIEIKKDRKATMQKPSDIY